jgi:hypothetical protein
MDPARRQELLRQRAVAKASLSRMQTFIDSDDRKVNEIQMRFNKLPDIFNKFETAQSELELSDDADHSGDHELLENQYYQIEAKFNELNAVVDPPLSRRSSHSILSGNSNQSPRSHVSSTHIKLQVIALPTFHGNSCNWLQFRDTFEALIVNKTLSKVQKFHYLIGSLTIEAKDLISNLHITNENFSVAWQLVTQHYLNKLIAMMHAKRLCQMPQVKGEASTLHQLVNHAPC